MATQRLTLATGNRSLCINVIGLANSALNVIVTLLLYYSVPLFLFSIHFPAMTL